MLEKFSADIQKDLAFQIVVAIRDTISIAKKSDPPPTYENAIRILHDISPELYEDVIKQLPQKNLSETAKFYQSKAELQSHIDKIQVTPAQVIQADIDELKDLLAKSNDLDSERKSNISQRLIQLEAAKINLKPRQINENRILQRDFSKIDRIDFGHQFVQSDDFKIDYQLKNDTYLRVRLLHPDKPEHVTGADLIYEQHNEESGKIRLMFLQYKIWEDGVLYFSQAGNLEAQLLKMKALLCDHGFCDKPDTLKHDLDYRFPYCSAFLRPTDKLQQTNEKLISSGIHIPICSALRFKQEGESKIDKKYIRHQTLTHKIFEHLFNRALIGSKWLDETEVERLYKENGIIDSDDTVKIYAREICGKNDRF
jgi:hypothetical protein